MGLETVFAPAEGEAIDYLRHEIEWHRRVGRYLVTVAASGFATSAALLREALSDGSPTALEWITLLPALLAVAVGGPVFYTYYRRILTLKRVTQRLIALRMPDPDFRDRWWQAFIPWNQEPRL